MEGLVPLTEKQRNNPNYKEVSGEMYNRFIIKETLGYKVRGGKREKIVKVLCDCGNERVVDYKSLKQGKRKACGCINEENKIKIAEGDKFGLWTVVKEAENYESPKGEKGRSILCKCICGKEKSVLLNSLTKGSSKSCGCQGRVKEKLPPVEPKDENIFKSFAKGTSWKFKEQILTRKKNGSENVKVIYECKCGSIKEKSYLNKDIKLPIRCSNCYQLSKYIDENFPGIERLKRILSSIKGRCRNPNTKDYYLYGERGIKVSDKWERFMSFYTWAINNGYKEGLTIDRKDSSKNYDEDNCQWVTKGYNSAKISNRKFTWKDVENIRTLFLHTDIKELADKFSSSESTIKSIKNFKSWNPNNKYPTPVQISYEYRSQRYTYSDIRS